MEPSIHLLDWFIISLFFISAIFIGGFFAKNAGKSVSSFFLGERKLTWWLAGTSMLATTFASDTPLAVTGIVALGGLSGNWIWWCWGIAHVCSTFFFAKLWRRSGVITDAEIIEVRYSGKAAAILRAIKAIYFGVFINCLGMAWVLAAMIKISRSFFTIQPWFVVIIAMMVSALYTTMGGFWSIVITDFFQFFLGIIGAIILAIMAVKHFGGMGELVTSVGGEVTANGGLLGALETAATSDGGRSLSDLLSLVPGSIDSVVSIPLFITFVFAGWWRYAEGSGYIVQRLAACKSEGHAQGAALWYSVGQNALRPWPWFIVGFASLVVFPYIGNIDHNAKIEFSNKNAISSNHKVVISPAQIDVASGGDLYFQGIAKGSVAQIGSQKVTVQENSQGQLFAHFNKFSKSQKTNIIITQPNQSVITAGPIKIHLTDREMAYPLLMGKLLPTGLLGLMLASLLAAFMSTMDTHSSWGASYLVQDLYRRFIRKNASEKHYVLVGRVSILLIMIIASLIALIIESISSVWVFLVTIGAGIGSVSALRWFWHRVTPHAEIAALSITTILAFVFQIFFTPHLFGSPNDFFIVSIPRYIQILIIALTSITSWVMVCFFGPQNDKKTLQKFYDKVRPPGPGWNGFNGKNPSEPLKPIFIKFIAGLIIIYSSLIGLTNIIFYGQPVGYLLILIAAILMSWVVYSSNNNSNKKTQ